MPAPPEINLDDFRPLEVKVTGSFEDAVRRFKSMVQKSKILSEVKERQYFEKPSDKKRRKSKEARQRQKLADLRGNQDRRYDEFDE